MTKDNLDGKRSDLATVVEDAAMLITRGEFTVRRLRSIVALARSLGAYEGLIEGRQIMRDILHQHFPDLDTIAAAESLKLAAQKAEEL